MNTTIEFFLSTPASTGFFHCFPQAYPCADNTTVLLLKGCAGSGKSTLLQQIVNTLSCKGADFEQIRCSANTAALDAVICTQRGFAAFDATPPHAWEPKLPAALEQIISLYEVISHQTAKQYQQQLCTLQEHIQVHHARAIRYIAAATCLLDDSTRTAMCCTNTAKIRRLAQSLAARHFPARNKAETLAATHTIRLLSAFTPQGCMLLEHTLPCLADCIFCIDDPWGASAPILLAQLQMYAAERGVSTISCRSPLHPEDSLSHLILPELRLAFTTQDCLHTIHCATQRMIHAHRFTNTQAMAARKNRLRFNRKSAYELLQQAYEQLALAARAHSEMEQIHLQCMNQEKLKKISSYAASIVP